MHNKRNCKHTSRLQDKKSRIFGGKCGMINKVWKIVLYKVQKEEEGRGVGEEEKAEEGKENIPYWMVPHINFLMLWSFWAISCRFQVLALFCCISKYVLRKVSAKRTSHQRSSPSKIKYRENVWHDHSITSSSFPCFISNKNLWHFRLSIPYSNVLINTRIFMKLDTALFK
jgi:hypothetical protein